MRSYKGVWRVVSPAGEVVGEKVIEDWKQAGDHAPPVELLMLMPLLPACSGWKLRWSAVVEPGKPWSRERRARERRRRLRVRLERKYPLFAEIFYEEELASRPLYFDARHPVYDAGRPGGPEAGAEEE